MCYTLSNNTGIITVLLIYCCYYQVVIKSLHSAVQNILLKTFHMQFDVVSLTQKRKLKVCSRILGFIIITWLIIFFNKLMCLYVLFLSLILKDLFVINHAVAHYCTIKLLPWRVQLMKIISLSSKRTRCNKCLHCYL